LLNRIDVAKENAKKLLWNRIGMIIVLSSMVGKIGRYTSVWSVASCVLASGFRVVVLLWLVALQKTEKEIEFPKDIRATRASPILVYVILIVLWV
jgi:hypothetical protein